MLHKDTAILLKLFSRAFAYPDMQLAELIASGTLQRDLFQMCIATGMPENIASLNCESMMQYYGYSSEDIMHELRQEYSALFLGRFPLASYSEGVWLCKKEGYKDPPLMINPRSIEVQEFQRSCGVIQADDYRDSIDTVDSECEFAAYLADNPEFPKEWETTSRQKYREFIDLHMRQWIPGFCEDIECVSNNVYYRGMVGLLKESIVRA